jgi:alkylated DNA repair protein (DNA oxidative demethylase)
MHARRVFGLTAKADKGHDYSAMHLQSDMNSFQTGFRLYPGHFDRDAQVDLLTAVREVLRAAPLFTPRMPKSGRPFSVRMSNCGALGWVSDENGYRYQPSHPQTGAPWPPIPSGLMQVWERLARFPDPPEACLINFYDPQAKMGLHQDRDETEFDAPVISISLGDTCLFRLGGCKRNEPTRSVRLSSGDVVVLGGAARLAFHGVDRIFPGTSRLLPEGGRINLTLRRVTRSRCDTSTNYTLDEPDIVHKGASRDLA